MRLRRPRRELLAQAVMERCSNSGDWSEGEELWKPWWADRGRREAWRGVNEPRGGVFRREADGQGQDIHLVRLTTMGANRYKKGSWGATAVRPGDLVEEMGL